MFFNKNYKLFDIFVLLTFINVFVELLLGKRLLIFGILILFGLLDYKYLNNFYLAKTSKIVSIISNLNFIYIMSNINDECKRFIARDLEGFQDFEFKHAQYLAGSAT